ncbi:MAG: radical SAM protein [Planctomycetes bacterium]|nr:radical SAM protein [Planctomycetota bacterium]
MKIGLIAMSGIRACDPELLELGLTLPGFVERSKAIASLPSLGLLTLAGMTPAEHEVRYMEVADLNDADALPMDFDLVAISSFSAQILEGYKLGQRYAARGVPVVTGGLHVTSVPGEPAEYGLSAMLGEGEIAWGDILEDAKHGKLEDVYEARGVEFDLGASPMPAYELLDMSRYNRITVQTSRGCPWKCSFCASSILLTQRYKQKPIERVLAEVDAIGARWRRPYIEFADDNAFVNRRYWSHLLPELADRHVRWFTETDITIADADDAFIDALREAGCRQVLIGMESPIAAGLDGLELRRNFKSDKWRIYKQAIARLQSMGILVNACFVLGLDGQPSEVFDAIYEFVADAKPFDVQITYQTPFPGTPLYAQLKREGRLTHDGQWNRCTLFDINYEPRPMSAGELRAGFFDLAQRLYNDDFSRWRREHWRDVEPMPSLPRVDVA